ncbi:MAG: CoA-binding protein [Desulfopila sp.]
MKDIRINNIRMNDIRQLLEQSSIIAVVGLSAKTQRPSNMVARYLIEAGYTIVPVNPGQDTILGLPCYPDISSIPGDIDIVDIFRRSEEVTSIVEQAVQTSCSAIWMQEGVVNHEAAELAMQHGKKVIMDRCIKVDHATIHSEQ